ncbi:DUF998 domain-containing protein [Micromonospora radicis]|uniref:DUF998 domain-containing protein n=1 Tax=Micromonospora radicis TaxID=1894971 RepID=A0A418N176_9ACTN|nr:DUF998 domain-containing protein [Micromonospora radicis]
MPPAQRRLPRADGPVGGSDRVDRGRRGAGVAWWSGQAWRVVVPLLVAAALATTLSGAVTCSAGCPLPPFERATVADLVHGAASIAATAAVVLTMIAIALCRTVDRVLRRIAAIAATVALPLAGAVGLAMLLIGRSTLVGLLERLLLAVAVSWALTTTLTLTPTPRPHPPHPPHPPPPDPRLDHEVDGNH